MSEEPLAIEEIDDPDNVRVMLFVKGKSVHAPARSFVTPARKINAGNGLTGGGDLSEDRTISMGTPGTLSSSTTNAASGTTHTHNINETDIVSAGTASLDAGTIGTYALLRHAQTPSTLNFGENRAGSNLQPANAAGVNSPGTLGGTWKCMGQIGNTNVADGPTRVTLFLRVA